MNMVDIDMIEDHTSLRLIAFYYVLLVERKVVDSVVDGQDQEKLYMRTFDLEQQSRRHLKIKFIFFEHVSDADCSDVYCASSGRNAHKTS
jgi:hypothetical protein